MINNGKLPFIEEKTQKYYFKSNMKNTEIWKQIKNYDKYEVSNLGRVRNKKTGRILKCNSSNTGYTVVCLCQNSINKTHSVHRLVMETFNPVDNMNELEVNHKDWDKTNNTLDNLEWMTKQQNLLYGSGPTELKGLESRLCNAIRHALHKWYDMLLTVKCTKDTFTEQVVENAINGAAELYKYTHNNDMEINKEINKLTVEDNRFLTIIQESSSTGFRRICTNIDSDAVNAMLILGDDEAYDYLITEVLPNCEYNEFYDGIFDDGEPDEELDAKIDTIYVYISEKVDGKIKNKLTNKYHFDYRW